MGKFVRIGWLVVLASACVGFASSSASAGHSYTMSLVSGGANQASLDPGQSLSLDLILASTNDQTWHDGADLLVSLSRSGLELTSWDWASPQYLSGGPYDFTRIASRPAPSGGDLRNSLPQAITSTYGIGFSAETANFGDFFGTGTLLSFGLTVPDSYETNVDVVMDVSGSFHDSATLWTWIGVSTGPFTLHITPEPATLMLLGIGGLAVLRRRRTA